MGWVFTLPFEIENMQRLGLVGPDPVPVTNSCERHAPQQKLSIWNSRPVPFTGRRRMYRNAVCARRTATVCYWMPAVGLTVVSRRGSPASSYQRKRSDKTQLQNFLVQWSESRIPEIHRASHRISQESHALHKILNHQKPFLDPDDDEAFEGGYKFENLVALCDCSARVVLPHS